jgi:hypothetical protein
MAVARNTVVGAALLGLWGCAGSAPEPSSQDVVFPAWVDDGPRKERPETRVVEEQGLTSHAGRETTQREREARAERSRERDAPQPSTLLPKSADSKFFGGCGSTKQGSGRNCSKEP